MSAWGAVETWTLGNGVDVERDRDPGTGAITAITAGPGHSASRVSLAYGTDTRGNTHTATDLLTNVSRTLGYGNLSRLKRITLTNPNGTYVYSAGYDAAGNLSSRTGVGTYDYTGTQPHAVTQTTLAGVPTNYAYNSLGQMTSGGSLTQIQWSQAGRASQIQGSQTASLAYDTDGNLLQKAVAGGTTSRYFGRLFVKVGSGWRERIVANGEVIAIVNVSVTGYVTTDYLVHDNEGSPAVLLDASGNLAARFAWNAWGELVDPATGIGPDPDATTKQALTTLGYTGHEMFWKSGLVATWARLYNPAIGRWLSPDPTVPNLANGQSFNRYSYVLNNPLSLWDPEGLKDVVDLTPITVWGNKPCPSGGIPIIDTSSWTVLDCVGNIGSGGGGSGAGSNNGDASGGNGGNHGNNNSSNPKSQCPQNPTSAAKVGTDKVKYADASGNWEIRSDGSASWVTNNPDNMQSSTFANAHGAIGSYNSIAVFPSYSSGFAADAALWGSSGYQGESTLLDAVNRWTGNSFTATSPYMQSLLQGLPGATATTRPSDLSPSQIAAAQQTPEGWETGQVTCGGSGG